MITDHCTFTQLGVKVLSISYVTVFMEDTNNSRYHKLCDLPICLGFKSICYICLADTNTNTSYRYSYDEIELKL